MFNFIDTCRLCTTDTKNVGIDCISNDELNNIIRKLYQIDITTTDQLSKEICNACYESVTKFYFHYEIVKTAQKNQLQCLKMQLSMANAKPKTETKDDDSDVEFVSTSPLSPNGKSSSVGGGANKFDPIGTKTTTSQSGGGARIVTDNGVAAKRPSTSITIKNNNKTVISPRPVRCSPSVVAKRVLNVTNASKAPPPPPEPNAVLQMNVDGAKKAAATTQVLRTVNVVTRQNDGTVILRKVRMRDSSGAELTTMKRPSANQSTNTTTQTSSNQSMPSTQVASAPATKRVKIDNQLIASANDRAREIDPKRLSQTIAAATSTVTTRAAVVVREARKITAKMRRAATSDNSAATDADKVTMAPPLSASEHQYAKRNNNDGQSQDVDKPMSLTPLSATEHHYSKRNNDSVAALTIQRNRYRPTAATATVVATAADSTRTDEINAASRTTAISPPILLNEMLNKIKPSIRVRSVHSLNNNAKNG